MTLKRFLLAPLVFPTLLLAQNGDRDGHDDMSPVVPADEVPPAPVLAIGDALKSFQIADGFVIEPVATEPMVDRPVDIKFDGNGRMWVVEMIGYMPDLDGHGEDEPNGRIVVLEDTDNDGKSDKRTVFLDGLVLPRAIALVKDGLLVGDQHKLWFCGRKGIERTSDPVVVDENFAPSGNVEHKTNGLMPHLNNWLYCAKSDVRYRWRNGKLEKDATQFRGQWGITMDDFGRLFHNHNSTFVIGDRLLPETIESHPTAKLNGDCSTNLANNRVYPIRVTPGVNRAYIAKSNGYGEDTLDPRTHKLINTTASAGLEIYRGDQFPEEWKGISFTCESVVNLVKAIRIKAEGLELKGEHVYKDKEFLASTDERFRPVSIHTAPDGSLYLVDMYHGLIQHRTYMTSYLRDQYASRNLDKPARGLGRIYRIRSKAKPLGPQPRLEDASSDDLLKALGHPNGWWRDTAQRLLVERNEPGTVEKLKNGLRNHPSEIARAHILWTLEGLNQIEAEDLAFVIKSSQGPGEINLIPHAYAVAIAQPGPVREQLAALNTEVPHHTQNAIARIRFLASTNGYRERLMAELENSKFTPFATEAAATGLLSQKVTDFPKTNTKLDEYLANFAKHHDSLPPEKRLSGDHLASFQRGKELYLTEAACIGCHGADGAGMPNLGPPLNESEWATGPTDRFAKILLHGLQGPITVNGVDYTPLAEMPGLAQNPSLSDQDLADIMTYVRAEWDNSAGAVEAGLVKEVREKTKDRAGRVYRPEELPGQ